MCYLILQGDEDESMEEAISPSKPKRRSKRLRKRLEGDEVIVPYQQTIQLDSELPRGPRLIVKSIFFLSN